MEMFFFVSFVIQLLGLIIFLILSRGSILRTLLVLCFFSGLFEFIDNELGFTILNQLYKIIIFSFLVFLFYNYSNKTYFKNLGPVILSFLVLTIYLSFTFILIDNDFINFFVQFSKFCQSIFLLFILNKVAKTNINEFIQLKKMIVLLVSFQIILSIIKILFMGTNFEAIVGSISNSGAASATILPILFVILLFVSSKKLELDSKAWWLVILSLLIPLASDKRAIWFVFPIVLILLYTYLTSKIKSKYIMLLPVILFAIFYFGLRINKTLNPENSNWGSFDPVYAYNYSLNYSMGYETEGIDGRGAGLLKSLNMIIEQPLDENNLFGYGVNNVYDGDYFSFYEKNFWIVNKASGSGSVRYHLAFGYPSMILIFLFYLTILFSIKNIRLRNIILILFSWEYFLYLAVLVSTYALNFLLIYLIVYSNKFLK